MILIKKTSFFAHKTGSLYVYMLLVRLTTENLLSKPDILDTVDFRSIHLNISSLAASTMAKCSHILHTNEIYELSLLVFWIVMQCGLIGNTTSFGGTSYLIFRAAENQHWHLHHGEKLKSHPWVTFLFWFWRIMSLECFWHWVYGDSLERIW
jgi:hypothetical protein